MDNLVITNNAAKKIIELSKKKEKKVLRITVTGGGCQGFQYNLDMENSSKEKDIIIKKNSAIVVVDKNSLNFKGWETKDVYSNDVSFTINNLITNNQIVDGFFKIPKEEDL